MAKAGKQGPQGDDATVTAVLVGHDATYESEMDMSSDLPADSLGELVADVLQDAWKAGEDPAGLSMLLHFRARPRPRPDPIPLSPPPSRPVFGYVYRDKHGHERFSVERIAVSDDDRAEFEVVEIPVYQ